MRYVRYIMFLAVLGSAAVLPAEAQDAGEQRLEITAVRIEGNSAFTAEELKKLMVTRSSRLFSTSWFDREALERDIRVLERYYREQGYLDAVVDGYETIVGEEGNAVEIVLHIREGRPTLIRSVTFEGNESFADTVLQNRSALAPGDRFRRPALEESSVSIMSFYGTNGFTDANVEPQVDVDEESNSADVVFRINENRRFTIGDIVIEGLEKTRPSVVRQELTFAADETVNYSELLNSQRQLYRTGLFRSVYVHAVQSASGQEGVKDVLIEIEEKDSIRMAVAVGYDTVEEVRGKVDAYTINLGGSAKKLGFSGKVSFINRSATTSYTDPRTLGTRVQTDLNALVEYQEEPSYDLLRRSFSSTLGRRIYDTMLIRAAFRQENAEARNITLSDPPERTRNNISSLSVSFRYDTRNSMFNASKGTYLELTGEWGGYFSNTTITFIRGEARLKYFTPYHSHTVFGSSLEAGIIDAEHGLSEIPLSERFYAGGSQSVRGFDYNRLGPLDRSGDPLGGKIKLVWNVLEIRRHIYKMFTGAVFYDVGNIWTNSDTFTLDKLRSAVGAGIRARTPLGVIRVDYGYNIDPRPNETRNHYYFSLGQAF